jgi:hypothetical protein
MHLHGFLHPFSRKEGKPFFLCLCSSFFCKKKYIGATKTYVPTVRYVVFVVFFGRRLQAAA